MAAEDYNPPDEFDEENEDAMDYESLEGEVRAVTDRAVLLHVYAEDDDGGEEVWIPRSLLEDDGEVERAEVGDQVELSVPCWKLRELGL